jgi:hypothetical protein
VTIPATADEPVGVAADLSVAVALTWETVMSSRNRGRRMHRSTPLALLCAFPSWYGSRNSFVQGG